MERTQIPKPSQIKKPKTVQLSVLRTITENVQLPAKGRRRSNSIADLRSIGMKQIGFVPKVSKPIVTMKSKPIPKTVSKSGQKRMNTDQKNVVRAKVPRIPEWDYKSRFQELNEKYTNLLESHKNVKQKCSEMENLEIQLQDLTKRHQVDTERHNELLLQDARNVKEIAKLQTENRNFIEKIKHLENVIECNMNNIAELRQELCESNILRRVLHNTIQDLKGNIRVLCRVRPPLTSEYEKFLCPIRFLDEQTFEIRKPKESITSTSEKQNVLGMNFSFDKVFPPETSQEEVFEELSQLVQSAVDGYHVCVFAYGQTGSGKTYTMQGGSSLNDLGMIPRTIDTIFETITKLKRGNWTYEVQASFLEIYNETVNDLLQPNSDQVYEIRFNEGRGTTVTNLKIETISSARQLKDLMDQANVRRTVAATDFNDHSSRSHAVTKIYLRGVNNETKSVYIGSINLVDLAGSERAKAGPGERLEETKCINKSLSTLGNVMLALHNKDHHVPYRNSKLTFLLQSCLGGNSKTLMIVNIAPFEESYNESVSSLRFATKVKEVKTIFKKNKITLPMVNAGKS